MLFFKYPLPLVQGVFLKRYKRFFVDVQMPDGSVQTVHCANTGSMQSCLVAGAPAYILDSQSNTRKLRYSLELLRLDDGLACLNTSRANQFVEALFLQNLKSGDAVLDPVFSPWGKMRIYSELKREVVFTQNTRFDFCLTSPTTPKKCWIEVKSVSLQISADTWAFPDAVTKRGQKHLQELVKAKQAGDDAWLFFVLMRGSDVAPEKLYHGFRIASEIDKDYALLFDEAKKIGVQVAILIPDISSEGFFLRKFYVHI